VLQFGFESLSAIFFLYLQVAAFCSCCLFFVLHKSESRRKSNIHILSRGFQCYHRSSCYYYYYYYYYYYTVLYFNRWSCYNAAALKRAKWIKFVFLFSADDSEKKNWGATLFVIKSWQCAWRTNAHSRTQLNLLYLVLIEWVVCSLPRLFYTVVELVPISLLFSTVAPERPKGREDTAVVNGNGCKQEQKERASSVEEGLANDGWQPRKTTASSSGSTIFSQITTRH